MRALQDESLTPMPYELGPRAPLTETDSPEYLDSGHFEALRLAISNLLATDVAEFTYAQIIDGLPTTSSFYDFHSLYETKDHPAQLHPTLCDGVMDQIYKFKSAFDLLSLRFEPYVLQAFQNETPGSRGFHLRLIELAAVACHQIGVYLFQHERSNHEGEYDAWMAEQHKLRDAGAEKYQYYPLEPPVPFYHQAYTSDDMYPHAISDIVGYWAEAKIFGGVVLFDRGETDKDCNEVFLHGALRKGPRTIYPLTADQFQILVEFLTAKQTDVACPVPIYATQLNRPRYDPYHALKYCHIFRNKYERRLPERFISRDTFSARDYPETADQMWVLNHQYEAGAKGIPVDQEALRAAQDRMKQISPSSPLWGYDPRYI